MLKLVFGTKANVHMINPGELIRGSLGMHVTVEQRGNTVQLYHLGRRYIN